VSAPEITHRLELLPRRLFDTWARRLMVLAGHGSLVGSPRSVLYGPPMTNSSEKRVLEGIALPSKGTVTEFHLSTGKIALESGPIVKIRSSQCRGIEPKVGSTYYVCQLGIDPRFGGIEVAALLTTTEFELTAMFGIASVDQITYDWVLSLSGDERARIANRVVDEVCRPDPEHVVETLFRYVAEIAPASFHPFLDGLDPGRYPHYLAFRRAPLSLLERYVQRLERSTAPPSVELATAGDLVETGDFVVQSRSASNDEGAALIALASSEDPRALAVVQDYLERTCREGEAAEIADSLLLLTGYARSSVASSELVRWQYDVCYELDPVGPRQRSKAVMWRTHKRRCVACGARLIGVLHIDASLIEGIREDGPPLDVTTCLSCVTALDAYFVHYDANHEPTTLLPEPLPAGYEPEKIDPERPVEVVVRGAPLARGSWSDPTAGRGSFDRVGGQPTWLQGPRSFYCPHCGKVMKFLAQASDLPEHLATFLFAFECRPCGIVATTLERG